MQLYVPLCLYQKTRTLIRHAAADQSIYNCHKINLIFISHIQNTHTTERVESIGLKKLKSQWRVSCSDLILLLVHINSGK